MYYAKRALEILREEGAVELSKASIKFVLRALDPQHYRRFRFHTWKNHLQNRIKYDAPPDPYNRIEIQPIEIDRFFGRDSELNWQLKKVKYRGLARTKGGNWDLRYRPKIENSWIIQGLIERFEKGIDWENTQYYNHYFKKYQGTKKHEEEGFKDLQEYMSNRCENYEKMFEDIKINGYESEHTGSRLVPGSTQPIRDRLEVLVVIDRNGEIGLFEGNHRFAIARILNIEIPAQVVCRHKKWQEYRDEIHRNGLPEGREELRDHPDLQDVLD